FNVTGLMDKVEVSIGGAAATEYVRRVEYDAAGRRTLIELGNDAATTYTYDPLTRRVTAIHTTTGGGVVQDLGYVYDAAGNVSHTDDATQQTVFFRNRRVDPSSDYVYDALY